MTSHILINRIIPGLITLALLAAGCTDDIPVNTDGNDDLTGTWLSTRPVDGGYWLISLCDNGHFDITLLDYDSSSGVYDTVIASNGSEDHYLTDNGFLDIEFLADLGTSCDFEYFQMKYRFDGGDLILYPGDICLGPGPGLVGSWVTTRKTGCRSDDSILVILDTVTFTADNHYIGIEGDTSVYHDYGTYFTLISGTGLPDPPPLPTVKTAATETTAYAYDIGDNKLYLYDRDDPFRFVRQ